MTDNDIVKAIPFEETIECYKEDIQGFFNRYKNESGAEDCIEVCLIRAGYRTVLKAEEEINRLQAENENLTKACENQQKISMDRYFEIERLRTVKKHIDILIHRGIEYPTAEAYEKAFQKTLEQLYDNTNAKAYKECIEKVKEEITEALKSNYKAKAERLEKHNVGDKTDFISYCGGKIDCLRGLDDFLDNLLKELVGEE